MNNSRHNVTMAVFRERWTLEQQQETNLPLANISNPDLHQAVYLLDGSAHSIEHTHNAGSGFYLNKSSSYLLPAGTEMNALRFILTSHAASSDELLIIFVCNDHRTLALCETFQTTETSTVLRLDQVDFPPGAVAHRHTHPGGGLRYLTRGTLQLHGPGSQHDFASGDAWFEEANSPVLAKANETQASQFVRMMLLPSEFEGKSTFTLADQTDAKKPRLQTNTRFFDLPIVFG